MVLVADVTMRKSQREMIVRERESVLVLIVSRTVEMIRV